MTELLHRGRHRLSDASRSAGPAEQPEQREPASGLSEYLGLAGRRWRLIVAVVALCLLSAFVYSTSQTKIYESTAEVLVQPVSLAPTQAPPITAINGDAEVRIATSATVKALALTEIGAGHPRASIAVSAPANSNALVFVASSSSPSEAQKAAEAYADSYLRARLDNLLKQVSAVRAPLESQLATVTKQIAAASTALSGATTPAQQALLSTQLTSLTARQSSLYQQLDAIVQPGSVTPGSVITPAARPTHPSRPNTEKTLLLALFAGAGLAIGLAMLRDRLDRRIRRTDDLARGIRAPVLTMVPTVALMGRLANSSELLDGDSEFTRAFRTLRATIKPALAHGLKTVLVTSPTRGDGKTTTVANLGRVLARSGAVVVLVAADFEHPDLGPQFDVHPEYGLTSVMSGLRSATEALATAGDGLHVLDVGPKLAIAAELLGSPPMAGVLASLDEFADIVLIDAPAVLDRADALAIAPLADATLVVIDAQKSTLSDIDETRHLLASVGANVVGAVLNNVYNSRLRPHSIRLAAAPAATETEVSAEWSA